MSANTKIQWCDDSWPITSGCDDVSPGCLNCYAKGSSWRMMHNPNEAIARAYEGTAERRGGVTRWTGRLNALEDRLAWPFSVRRPRRVFVGNMSDLFHDAVPDDFLDHAFAAMALNPHLTFQVLTKRAARMRDYLADPARPGKVASAFRRYVGPYGTADAIAAWCDEHGVAEKERYRRVGVLNDHGGMLFMKDRWPLPNVWAGVSVEDQARADERVPILLGTPAAIRFLSVEPMLGPVKLWEFDAFDGRLKGCGVVDDYAMQPGSVDGPAEAVGSPYPGLDWIVCGGESGPKARPFELGWARELMAQCREAGVAYFHKQMGSNPWTGHRRTGVNPKMTVSSSIVLRDSHGSDMAEWDEEFRVREFPEVAGVPS